MFHCFRICRCDLEFWVLLLRGFQIEILLAWVSSASALSTEISKLHLMPVEMSSNKDVLELQQ